MRKHILFVSLPLRGHTSQMIALAQELASRGHQVSFALSEEAGEWIENTGASLIPWNSKPDSANENKHYQSDSIWYQVSREKRNWHGEKMMLKWFIEAYSPMYTTLEPIFQKYRPDTIIVDRAVIPAMDLSWQMKIPCIIQTRFLGNFVKIGSNLPGFSTSYSIKMNQWERLVNKWRPLFLIPHFLPAMKKLNHIRSQCTGCQDLPNPYAGHSVIVGTIPDIEIPCTLPPRVKVVGPILPKIVKPLQDSLKRWLEDGEEGTAVIYVAFGTLAILESWQARELVEGMADARFRVLLSIPRSQQHLFPALSPSFRVESFVPQQAVLAHTAVRIFVSHCSPNGINEALYYGKPILGLPFFGDQHYFAARMQDLGVGLKLNKENFEGNEVSKKIHSLFTDQSYRQAAQDISVILQNTEPLEIAADLVEAEILKTPF